MTIYVTLNAKFTSAKHLLSSTLNWEKYGQFCVIFSTQYKNYSLRDAKMYWCDDHVYTPIYL